MINRFIYSLGFVATLFAAVSCSDSDYINTIPAGSTAIVRVDMRKAANVENVLGVDDIADCGLNFSSPVYLFESPDGNIGITIEVDSKAKVEKWLKRLATKGDCQQPVERRDFLFTVLKASWVVGVGDEAAIIMGPATAAMQPELLRTVTRLLQQDEEDGAKNSPLFTKLDDMDATVALVAQGDALPQALAAPFMLGAPKDATPSQLTIAARMNAAEGKVLEVKGETSSDNKQIDNSLKQAHDSYRPIAGKFLSAMADSSAIGLFMNVDGKNFLKLMQQNKMLLQLMSGINTVIDINKIVGCVDGDMAVIVPRQSDTNPQLMWGAELHDASFLSDVDYWKKSVPAGGKMTDIGPDFYYYTDGSSSFSFGVSNKKLFYSGTTPAAARSLLAPSASVVPKNAISMVRGKRMAAVVNLARMASGNDAVGLVQTFLKPLFGQVDFIVYTME